MKSNYIGNRAGFKTDSADVCLIFRRHRTENGAVKLKMLSSVQSPAVLMFYVHYVSCAAEPFIFFAPGQEGG